MRACTFMTLRQTILISKSLNYPIFLKTFQPYLHLRKIFRQVLLISESTHPARTIFSENLLAG